MPNPTFRHQEPDPSAVVADVVNELEDYAADISFLRDDAQLRAGRIVSVVENALLQEFAAKLRKLGHEDEADEYDRLSLIRERQAGQKGSAR